MKSAIVILAIVTVTGLEVYALSIGADDKTLAIAVGIIGALGGITLRSILPN